MFENIKSFMFEEDRTVFGLPISAFVEMLFFFTLMFGIGYATGAHDRWINIYLHPFWIIIILMTVQYGATMGVIAVLISTVILLVGNVPQRGVDENFFDYEFRTYSLPFMWLVVSLILGELVSRKQRSYDDLKRNYEVAKIQEKEIARGYEKLRATKEKLESRLASQLRSSVSTYQTLQILEETKPAKILLGLEQVVQSIMSPKKFSIYSIGPNGLEAAINSGWEQGDNYLRRFPTDSALYLHIIGEKKLLCVLNREDQKILNMEGILAAPLINTETGVIFGMLKIEELDIEELNLSNIESFRLICESAGLAYSHAVTFQKMLRNTIDDTKYPVASPQMMVRDANYLTHMAQGLDFPLVSIRVAFDEDKIGKEHMFHAVEMLNELTSTIFGPLARIYLGRGAVFILIIPFISSRTLEFSLQLLNKEIEEKIHREAVSIVVDWLHQSKEVILK